MNLALDLPPALGGRTDEAEQPLRKCPENSDSDGDGKGGGADDEDGEGDGDADGSDHDDDVN